MTKHHENDADARLLADILQVAQESSQGRQTLSELTQHAIAQSGVTQQVGNSADIC